MRGNPGAILAMAIGAIFLSLGWNGRYAAVWEAIRTGQSANSPGNSSETGRGDADPDTPGVQDQTPITGDPTGGNSDQIVDLKNRPVTVTTEGLGQATNATKVNGIFICPSDKTQILRRGINQCVPSDSVKVKPAGGMVPYGEDGGSIVLPNGVMAVRYQPNERGLFDAYGTT